MTTTHAPSEQSDSNPGVQSVPWAMQIALRVEKVDAPTDLEACEAAARACVSFLAEAKTRAEGTPADLPSTDDDGDGHDGVNYTDEGHYDVTWQDAVDTWSGVAIRKIVRRARGQRWVDAQNVPGVTVVQGKAQARAFVPCPIRPLPPELAKMQVEGTDLERGDSSTALAPVRIRISPLIEMTTGKTAAQCAHAAQRAWEAMDDSERAAWERDGFRVKVVRATPADWSHAPGGVSIVDAGFTELDGQHETTRADWEFAA